MYPFRTSAQAAALSPGVDRFVALAREDRQRLRSRITADPRGSGARNRLRGPMNEVVDAVIVGGGYAGLAAARRLTEEGRSTVVLEARDRVGGRTYTVEEAGATVDLGGQWVGPTQDHIYELAAETGVATFPQWTGGDDVVLEDGHSRRVRGEEDYDADDLAEYSTAVEAIEEAAAGIPLDRPWAAPQARSARRDDVRHLD